MPRTPTSRSKLATLQVPLEKAAQSLEERIAKGEELRDLPISTPEDLKTAKGKMRKWSDYNWQLLRRMVDTDELVNRYKRSVLIGSSRRMSFHEKVGEYRGDVGYYLNGLESIRESLDQLTAEDSVAVSPLVHEDKEVGNRVFIVHGRDEAAKQAVARTVEKLELEAIILHEQPNRGRTIIEKFEDYSDVGYAVVLLTPDDYGGENKDDLNRRARQNVILELGFFIGRLGRERVCSLYKPSVERPTDVSGVLWVRMDDAGAWKLKLAKEMKAVGLSVDLNKLV